MDVYKSVIAEYEDALIGKRKSVSAYYFSYGQTGNMKLALQVMKYAFETYLHWPPAVLRDYITHEILDRLKLKFLMRYIVFPPELDPQTDLFFLVWKIYPQTIHYSDKDLALRVYRNLLDGKIQKYPKEFFTGNDGVRRAQICLRYMIEQHLQFNSVKELYEFFSSTDCERVLRKNKLLVVSRDLYDSPLEYLHCSLPAEQQEDFWYRYYDFIGRRKEQLETIRNTESESEAT